MLNVDGKCKSHMTGHLQWPKSVMYILEVLFKGITYYKLNKYIIIMHINEVH